MIAKTTTIVATAAPTILTTTTTTTTTPTRPASNCGGGGGGCGSGSGANSINLSKRLLLSTISLTAQMLQLQKTTTPTAKMLCPASQRHEHPEQLHPIDTKRKKFYAVTANPPTSSIEANEATSAAVAYANANVDCDVVDVDADADADAATVSACIEKLSGKTSSTTTATATTTTVGGNIGSNLFKAQTSSSQHDKQRESRQRYALRPTSSEYANISSRGSGSNQHALEERSRHGFREFPCFESVGLSQQRSSKFETSSLSLVSLRGGGGGGTNCVRRPSHRKYKCKINNNNSSNSNSEHFYSRLSSSLPSTLVSVLRQIMPTTTTTKTTIKPATSALSTSYQHPHGRDCNVRLPKARCTKFRLLPTLGATSFITLLTLICLETVLLSTMSTCAKTFYMHWNTSNSIFRIDNTDHIIDVNKGNLAFEFDQVHIICPVYEPGTYENETEKYIIYNVSKVEYETCRITNADPRVIAICDKPQKLMFFTITFRPFTPQPGGLEFLPGNDYYFISTSSKDDLYRRIGGRCSTNNMKVVFKVCCAPEEKTKSLPPTTAITSGGSVTDGAANTGIVDNNSAQNIDMIAPPNSNQVGGASGGHHMNNINPVGVNGVNNGVLHGGSNIGMGSGGGGVHLKPIGGMGTAINTNIEQFNRIPIQPNLMGGNIAAGGGGNGANVMGGSSNGIMSTGHSGINIIPPNRGGGVSVVQYPGHHHVQTGIRINNVPTQQYYPPHKGSSNDDHHHYDKHPNEVVKNEELTYNSAATVTSLRSSGGILSWKWLMAVFGAFDSMTDVCRHQQQLQKPKEQQQQQHHYHHQQQDEQQQEQQEELIISDKCSSAALHFTQYMQQVYFNIQPLILFAVLVIIVNNCLCKYMLCTISKRNTKNMQTLQSSQLLCNAVDGQTDDSLAAASTSYSRLKRSGTSTNSGSSSSSSSSIAACDKCR